MRYLAAILAAIVLAGAASAQEGPRITVTGEGRIEAAPDMATISLGVAAEARSARAAMDQASAAAAALLARLESAGIAARDVQTSGLTLNPVWTYGNSGGENRITGYAASNTVTVRVRALENLGRVLDDVVEAGGNSFSGLQFGLADPGPTEDAARAAAVAEALRKAELYAAAAGLTLGPVLSISEAADFAPPQPMFRMEAAMASDAVPVAPGELTVSARVEMVFAIGG